MAIRAYSIGALWKIRKKDEKEWKASANGTASFWKEESDIIAHAHKNDELSCCFSYDGVTVQ